MSITARRRIRDIVTRRRAPSRARSRATRLRRHRHLRNVVRGRCRRDCGGAHTDDTRRLDA
jgi:hypothetical protein